jgi:hypothetical protein
LLKDERKSEDRGVFDEGPIPVTRDVPIEFFLPSIPFPMSVDMNVVTIAEENEPEGTRATDEAVNESVTTAVIVSDEGFAVGGGPKGTERTLARELPCIITTAEGHPIVVALTSDNGFSRPWTEESVVQKAERLAVGLSCISTIAEGRESIVVCTDDESFTKDGR